MTEIHETMMHGNSKIGGVSRLYVYSTTILMIWQHLYFLCLPFFVDTPCPQSNATQEIQDMNSNLLLTHKTVNVTKWGMVTAIIDGMWSGNGWVDKALRWEQEKANDKHEGKKEGQGEADLNLVSLHTYKLNILFNIYCYTHIVNFPKIMQLRILHHKSK